MELHEIKTKRDLVQFNVEATIVFIRDAYREWYKTYKADGMAHEFRDHLIEELEKAVAKLNGN